MPQTHKQAVHPRVCGEQSLSLIIRLTSPGFIPACAGNSLISRIDTSYATVHPRVCGEQINRTSADFYSDGSSPRVRGTVRDYLDVCTRKRFIPACAGNSSERDEPPPLATVHPRVCGEQKRARNLPAPKNGSSPRVRGTAAIDQRQAELDRFIPACAGNRSSTSAMRVFRTVHPRVCGEQESPTRPALGSTGSSPRVRGTGSF